MIDKGALTCQGSLVWADDRRIGEKGLKIFRKISLAERNI
jgi:hypothetical protein